MKRKAEHDVDMGIEKMYKRKKLENSMLYKSIKAQHDGRRFDAYWTTKEHRKESDNTDTNVLLDDNYIAVNDLEGARRGKALFEWQNSLLDERDRQMLHNDLIEEWERLKEFRTLLQNPENYTPEQFEELKHQVQNVERNVNELQSAETARYKGSVILNAFLEQKLYENDVRAEEFASVVGRRYRERNEYEQAVKDYKDKKE